MTRMRGDLWAESHHFQGVDMLWPHSFTGHSLSAVKHAPFHASVLRPASQVGPMHKAAGMGKLVNAALLSLMRRV